MLFVVAVLLGILAALGGWKLLGRRISHRKWIRLILAVAIGAAVAAVLYWGAVWVSILLFQARDRVGW